MWKVKRMNGAHIVVLTIAVGASDVAAYLASGSDSKPPPRCQAGVLSLALRGIADANPVEIGPDDRIRRRGNVNVVRYGVTDPTTIQM